MTARCRERWPCIHTEPPVPGSLPCRRCISCSVLDDKADDKFVCLLEAAAPEIVFHDGLYYIAALLPDIQGIRVARLTWIPDGMSRGALTEN